MNIMPGFRVRTVWFFLMVLLAFQAQAADWIYTVHPGDNLWDIAEKYLRKGTAYTARLQALNQIKNPKHLPPGSRVKIPLRWLKYQPVAATVQNLHGQCTAVTGQNQTISLKIGQILHAGDVLHCPENSSMMLRFADGSRLLVQKNSHLVLDTVSEYPGTEMVDTRVRLQSGEVDTQVQRKQGPGSRYEIITPSAVAAVRGTDFRVHADKGGDLMSAEVLQGRVNTTGQGVKRMVRQGFGVSVQAGHAPSRPKKLLPPPALDTLPETIHYLPVSFQWPEMDKAFQYRVQIAPDQRFEVLLFDQTTTKARIKISGLADGHYILRLRAIDYYGLEGLNAVFPFTVDARPEPPIPLNPKNGGNSYNQQPKFWWSKPLQISAYRFQLASDEAFENRLVDMEKLTETRVVPDRPLPFGAYYWRVASYDDQGKQGSYSEIQKLIVKEKPPAPKADAPAMDEEEINFHWKADPEAAQYLFQLSENEDFSEIMIEHQLEENSYSIPLSEIEPDTYYFRIKTINRDGVAGSFSPIQELEIPADVSPYWGMLLLLFLIPALL